eukprot:1221050-Pleurochrysis_carterae.AAC.1
MQNITSSETSSSMTKSKHQRCRDLRTPTCAEQLSRSRRHAPSPTCTYSYRWSSCESLKLFNQASAPCNR